MIEVYDIRNEHNNVAHTIAFHDSYHDFGLSYAWDTRVLGNPIANQSEKKDPYHVPKLQALLAESQQHEPGEDPFRKRRKLSIPGPAASNDSYFSKLPQEICDMIACHLPTPDVQNLRLTSRAFISTIYNPLFWRSRFDSGCERDWFFEARDKTQRRDSIWLYERTKDANLSPAMANRKRIYESIQRVIGLMGLRYSENDDPRSLLQAKTS